MEKTTNSNGLYDLIIIAKINKMIIDRDDSFEYIDDNLIIPIPKGSYKSSKPMVKYDTKEIAGVGGLFAKLRDDKDFKIIYCNDLGATIHGIDAIAIKNGVYYICEAKGTTSKKTYVSKFLKKTKKKGRQMSWYWIWRSLVDFADDSRNAAAFLELYENVILLKNVKRIVSISKLKKEKKKFIVSETKFYYDNDIEHLKGIAYYPNQKKNLKFLRTLCLANLDNDIIIKIKEAHSKLLTK